MYQSGDKIDGKALISAVRELAAERPDFVYPAREIHAGPLCYYTTEEGAGDCIIGCAMERIGQPLPTQPRNGNSNCDLLNGPVSEPSWERALDNITEFEFGWLWRVQSKQDSGKSWSTAVREADTWLSNMGERDY